MTVYFTFVMLLMATGIVKAIYPNSADPNTSGGTRDAKMFCVPRTKGIGRLNL
jgi:hypothetical protein